MNFQVWKIYELTYLKNISKVQFPNIKNKDTKQSS